MHEQVWDELGKIDYFLEQMGRAVERGEVHGASYDLLAPRYLERRAELVAVLERARSREEDVQVVPAAQPSTGPASTPQHVPMSTRPTAAPAAAVQPSAPRRERTPLSWTTVLVVTGAFLVIVASAIFALATWDLFGLVFQFAFLSAMTVAFYGAGLVVRRRLGSSAGGVALVTVASAMLLFDGWILISGFGLSGPWPWACWLLICSVAYRVTEYLLTGGVFGVAGAAAEVAWWWLLGEGLGWGPVPRLAGIAVAAAVWALAATHGRRNPSTEKMAEVLRWASPITIGIAVSGTLTAGVGGELTTVTVLSILVIAWAGVVVAELLGLPPTLGAIAHVPVVLAALSVLASATGGIWISLLLLIAALAALVYEVLRGGTLYGLAAPLLGAAAVAAAGATAEIAAGMRVAVVTLSGSAWVLAARWLRTRSTERPGAGGAMRAAGLVSISAMAVLAVASLMMLPVLGTVPLAGTGWALSDLVVVLLVWFAWTLAAFGGRSAASAAGSALMSFVVLAAVLDVSDVGWHASLLGVPFLALALIWVIVRTYVERATDLSAVLLLAGMRMLTPSIVGVPLVVDVVGGDFPHWTGALLIAAAAVWWVIDRVLDDAPLSVAPAAFFGVAAAALLGWWWRGAPEGAISAGAFAFAGAAAGVALRRIPGMKGVLGWTLVASALAWSPTTLSDSGALAVSLLLVAVAAVLSVVSSGVTEGAVVAVLVATAALLAALDSLAVSAWVSLLALGVAGFLCLAPLLLARGEGNPQVTRMKRTLAAAGLIPLLAAVYLGMLARAGAPLAGCADLGGHLFAVALMLLGVYVLGVAMHFDIEAGVYTGVGVLVLALLAELGAVDARWAELYSTPVALYAGWCGYRWAGRVGARRVPALTDVAATAILLGVPFVAMLGPLVPAVDSWVHTFAVFGLGIAAVVLGVALRVRTYFLGGIVALVLTALVRSWDLLVAWWWLVLGLVGTGMIVIALAREFRTAVAEGVRDLLDGWR